MPRRKHLLKIWLQMTVKPHIQKRFTTSKSQAGCGPPKKNNTFCRTFSSSSSSSHAKKQFAIVWPFSTGRGRSSVLHVCEKAKKRERRGRGNHSADGEMTGGSTVRDISITSIVQWREGENDNDNGCCQAILPCLSLCLSSSYVVRTT